MLSKPNSTQLNPTLKQLTLELDIVVTTTNFPATSRPARELKFCMRPNLTKLTTTQHNLTLLIT